MALPAIARNPRIIVIGGGGGTAAVYPEIARRTENAVAVLGIFDSGGSTGILSKEFDIPAVGDIRNVMMAASNNPAVREMRSHRFSQGTSFKGHPVGNLIVAACVMQYGLAEGIRQASLFLQVPGRILPVSLATAVLQLHDGPKVIKGEHLIDVYHPLHPSPQVALVPQVPINPEVLEAIASADLILIPGGSVYTSLLAVLSVQGVAEALARTDALKVLLANLATEQHQTDGWHVADYVLSLNRHSIYPDIVLYNTQEPSEEMRANYASEGEQPVNHCPELFQQIPSVRAIGGPFLSQDQVSRNPNDPIKRGLMRHDPKIVADYLWRILSGDEEILQARKHSPKRVHRSLL